MLANPLGNVRPHPIARLGSSHGYALEGDTASLNAEILFDETRLCGQHWFLQLWADDAIKIAEVPLGLLPVDGSCVVRASGSVEAFPPAGQAAHSVSMVLVSDLDGINDRAVYAQSLSLPQPRFGGTLCSSFTDEQVSLEISRIENPRPAANLSGTLALELWALDTPYSGGAWQGIPLASQIIGTLAGETELSDHRFSASITNLGEDAHLILMLREWSPAGYITRDFLELPRRRAGSLATEATPKKAAAKEPAVSAPAPVAATPAPAVATPAPAKSAKTATKAVTAYATGVSVNSATAKEITAVKGISDALARAIVAARPHKTIDDLLKVKGMGTKLLERVRGDLTL